ncbi:hypothetical protein [Gluconobacter cerinus]|uniref:hypothetical protein n=1 Tax=Gluconobacter cerinus TaxID=38307 RepID=UPI001B8C599C|nr:hypothetical protein [Gluconobacter cerinus]MBS1035551.1 hypothetical protein [Gluconobacter cerinus]
MKLSENCKYFFGDINRFLHVYISIIRNSKYKQKENYLNITISCFPLWLYTEILDRKMLFDCSVFVDNEIKNQIEKKYDELEKIIGLKK